MLHNKLPSLSCYCLSYSFSYYFPLVSVYFFQSTVFIILNSNKNSDVRWRCQNLWKSTTWYLVLRQKLLKILVFSLFACLLSQVWNTYMARSSAGAMPCGKTTGKKKIWWLKAMWLTECTPLSGIWKDWKF